MVKTETIFGYTSDPNPKCDSAFDLHTAAVTGVSEHFKWRFYGLKPITLGALVFSS